MKQRVFAGLLLALACAANAQDLGQKLFTDHCASCHGTDGNGGELGPNIASRVPLRSDEELTAVVRQGLGAAGMPAFPVISAGELPSLIGKLRSLKPRVGSAPVHSQLVLADGNTLGGIALNQSDSEMQLLGDDHRLHLLRRTGERWRSITSKSDWLSYNGATSGSRYTPLTNINRDNVKNLAPAWIFNFTTNNNLQTTPIVSEGVMYVTSANEVFALDAGSGREIWHYQRARTRGLIGNAAGGANRGAAIAGDRLYMLTDHSHLLALDKHSGALLWDTEMADWRQNYNTTGAPLPVGNLVIAGTSGGDEGVRGFVAAYDQATGREVWRWWSTPLPGEPGSETWQGPGIAHPAGSTWMTGTYDQALDTLYWTVGNPGPDMIGDDRKGDNLYTDSVVALDPHTGKLKWHFQFTPHDVWDYDAQETPALVDTQWQGKPRQLLVQANRNGFFYVLDRRTGEFLKGWQYVKEVTWASGLDAKGRPVRVGGTDPKTEGVRVCPSLTGGSNWYSTAYNPATGLYYVQTEDKCGIFTRVDAKWEAGKGYMGGSFAPAPEPAQRLLRAIDITKGTTVWQLPQAGRANTWGGVLATGGGLVFYGDDSGAFSAADATSGKQLWSFAANARWRASPMSYEFDGRQYIAIANGSTIMAFALTSNAVTAQVSDPRVEESVFGKLPEGNVVKQFTLRNHKGMTVKVINYGAIITAVSVPDSKGVAANVILGSDSLQDYLGRFSAAAVQGRYANRIANGHFAVDGKEYQVTKNIGEHHLHGGTRGFAKVVWDASVLPAKEHEVGVHMSYLSADGEEGYPGNLTAGITYTLTDNNELRLDYSAATDKATVVNLTNHAYFDLSATGKIDEHVLWINADNYTLADSKLIPTGELASVKGTPLDFTVASSIGSRAALIDAPSSQRKSFDHNFVIKGGGKQLVKAAEVRDPLSGRVMQVLTTQPGLQLFTGNPQGFCLETHHFPDSPNHPQFPSTTLRPGQPFASTTIYKFQN